VFGQIVHRPCTTGRSVAAMRGIAQFKAFPTVAQVLAGFHSPLNE
jgi:hypothetical protein